MKKNNLKSISKFTANSNMEKSGVNLMLGGIRGGSDGSSPSYSSSYTSGTNDCDGTAICKFCPKPIKG